jgi:hypothetical protein
LFAQIIVRAARDKNPRRPESFQRLADPTAQKSGAAGHYHTSIVK